MYQMGCGSAPVLAELCLVYLMLQGRYLSLVYLMI
jgi:hypothetical protein